jgi:hypothetical protein
MVLGDTQGLHLPLLFSTKPVIAGQQWRLLSEPTRNGQRPGQPQAGKRIIRSVKQLEGVSQQVLQGRGPCSPPSTQRQCLCSRI